MLNRTLVFILFWLKRGRDLGVPGFSGFFDFVVVRLHFNRGCAFVGVDFLLFCFIFVKSIVVYQKSGSRLTLSVIFVHFLQKYLCVPKLGSRLAFFCHFFIFFRSIVVYLKLGSRLTFLLTCSLAFL